MKQNKWIKSLAALTCGLSLSACDSIFDNSSPTPTYSHHQATAHSYGLETNTQDEQATASNEADAQANIETSNNQDETSLTDVTKDDQSQVDTSSQANTTPNNQEWSSTGSIIGNADARAPSTETTTVKKSKLAKRKLVSVKDLDQNSNGRD